MNDEIRLYQAPKFEIVSPGRFSNKIFIGGFLLGETGDSIREIYFERINFGTNTLNYFLGKIPSAKNKPQTTPKVLSVGKGDFILIKDNVWYGNSTKEMIPLYDGWNSFPEAVAFYISFVAGRDYGLNPLEEIYSSVRDTFRKSCWT